MNHHMMTVILTLMLLSTAMNPTPFLHITTGRGDTYRVHPHPPSGLWQDCHEYECH